jgi:peptide deformylase
MALLPVLLHPDPRLSQPCDPVGRPDDAIRRLASDMLETMYHATGRGLAAPQVGVLLRLFVMDLDWKDGFPAPQVMIDPVIDLASEARIVHTERCLSIPDQPRAVSRPAEVRLRWTLPAGGTRIGVFTGFAAACVQHELDHLDGRLILDHPPAPPPAPSMSAE